MRRYKTVKYKGSTIYFEDHGRGLILARAPLLTKQYLGAGKNKTEALKEAKKSIDIIKAELKKRRKK